MPVADPTIDQGDPGGELMQNPPQAGPPQTRSVVGPDGSLYVAGPYSQYNADPTKIPAVNPLPPLYPPGYQAWQPPTPPDPEEVAIQQQQKQLAEGPLNAQTIQASMQAAKAAQRFMAQRGLQRDLESGKDQAEAYRRWLPQILRDDPKALASFGAQVIKPQPRGPTPLPPTIKSIPVEGLEGYRAVPSASGSGYTIHKTVTQEDVKKMTPAQAAQTLAKIPELAGITPGITNMIPMLEKRAFEGLPQADSKKLTKEQAAGFFKEAGGDKAKARKLAKDAGFEF